MAVKSSFSQIGGNATPLQYSTHTYYIVMASSADIGSWGLYPVGTTQEAIENGTATALPYDVYAKVDKTWPSSDTSHFCIQFSTTANVATPEGNYVIGYKETTDDKYSCVTASVLNIHVYSPFDIDVSLNDNADAADCPDSSGTWKLPEDHAFKTTVQYLVTMSYPSTAEGGYVSVPALPWSFTFRFIVDGVGSGTNATIDNITITSPDAGFVQQDYTPSSGTSDYTQSCSVTPSSVPSLIFTVQYSDVLGVEQNIQFFISDISGPYGELDLDVINGQTNTVSNIVYAMPDVGDIRALN
jgi:hypothetical protein